MRILVVEEHDLIGDIIRKSLELDGYSVTVCSSIPDGACHAATFDYDLIVFDPQDTDLADSTIYLEFAMVTAGMTMLFLTRDPLACPTPANQDESRNYLVLPFSPTELKHRVKSLLGARRPASTLAYADVSLNLVTWQATQAGRTLELSSCELILLEHFLRHPCQIVEASTLMNRLWSRPQEHSRLLLSTLVSQLQAKLEAGDAPPLVRRVGFDVYECREVPASESARG